MSKASTTNPPSDSSNKTDDPKATGSKQDFPCHICSKIFADADQLRKHTSSHTGQKHHICSDCPESFYLPSELSEHRKNKHGKKSESVPVERTVNKRKAKDAAAAKSDSQSKAKAEPTAPIKRATRRPQVQVEVNKPVVVEKVQKVKIAIRKPGEVTKKPGEVSKSMFPLTGKVKPFVCKACGKGCAYQAHLDRHALVHSTEMPFKCEKCGAKFKREDGLKRHNNNVHKGAKRSA